MILNRLEVPSWHGEDNDIGGFLTVAGDGVPLVHFPHLKVDLGIRYRGKSNRDEIV